MKKKEKNGFTLVELLAVIVILAIILVIAVPQIISTIDESRNGAFASSAKLIASSAETLKLTNDTLGITEDIDCPDVAEYNSDDYQSCSIRFDDNGNAHVTLVGKGKFAGKYVCNGTRTEAVVTEESCTLVTLTVNLDGGTDTVDYEAKYEAGSKVTLTEPTKEGYTFNGWTVSGTGASVTDNELTMGTSATTVTATWKEPVVTGADTIAAKVGTGGLTATTATYTNADNEEKTENAGMRYVGPLTGDNAVKNQVYFNCEDEYTSDSKTIKYGDEDYVYKGHCETWRIIGVFDVEDGKGNTEKRIKIINTDSTFQASWDSSASETNSGYGVNQWGEVKDANGNITYAGADLMQLLNGYYIEKNNPKITNKKECKYNNASGQSGFSQTCDTTDAPLSNVNMKPLTSTALSMIDDAVWYTYATNTSTASTAYLQERGITTKYTGISECSSCSDGVTRTTSWKGLIGLMSVSDMKYANGWLYNGSVDPWSISPYSIPSRSSSVWRSYSSYADSNNANLSNGVWPAAYLSSNVQIIDGDGSEGNAFKLSVGEQ